MIVFISINASSNIKKKYRDNLPYKMSDYATDKFIDIFESLTKRTTQGLKSQ